MFSRRNSSLVLCIKCLIERPPTGAISYELIRTINCFVTEVCMSNPTTAEVSVFRAKRAANPVPYFIAGALFCGLAVLGFVAAIGKNVGQPNLTLMTTMPIMIGGGAIIAGLQMTRAPVEVRTGGRGLVLFFRKKTEKFPWEELAFASAERGVLQQRVMKIYNERGRRVATVTDALEDFDDLVEIIDGHLNARPDNKGATISKRKARRFAVFFGAFGVLTFVGAIFMTWHTYDQGRSARLLKEVGVQTDAEIVERRLAPNGVTPRLVYRVTNPEGRSAERNAQIERTVWDDLEGEKTVRVVYVPQEPSISHVLEGEVAENQENFGYLPGAILGVMSLAFLSWATLLAYGYSIDVDSKTGKVSIKPYGTGR
jgi:hypothetical protein